LIVIVAAGIAGAVIATRHSGGNTTNGSAGTANHTIAGTANHTVDGNFTVWFPTLFEQTSEGQPCYVPPAYGSEAGGDQVTITNGSGSTLALGTLGEGIAETGTQGGCKFSFSIPEVPDSAFYGVSIDGHDGPQYSHAEMQSNGWSMDLHLNA
jgi:hypothetical protein